MKAAAVTVFVCALAGATSGPAEAKSRWTLAQARAVLASKHFAVTDWSQPDLPDYELVFRRSAAKSLRAVGRRFVFDGLAHDEVTDGDVRVRFTFGRPGRLTGLRGPAADTSQPLFPIRAAFYYAWYPEAWSRNAVYPYSRFQPSLDYYSADDADIVRRHLAALRYAHLGAAIYSWWGPLGYPLTDTRFWRYLAAARTTPFRWAVYYEREGYEDPSVEKIRSDLRYTGTSTRPSLLTSGSTGGSSSSSTAVPATHANRPRSAGARRTPSTHTSCSRPSTGTSPAECNRRPGTSTPPPSRRTASPRTHSSSRRASTRQAPLG